MNDGLVGKNKTTKYSITEEETKTKNKEILTEPRVKIDETKEIKKVEL